MEFRDTILQIVEQSSTPQERLEQKFIPTDQTNPDLQYLLDRWAERAALGAPNTTQLSKNDLIQQISFIRAALLTISLEDHVQGDHKGRPYRDHGVQVTDEVLSSDDLQRQARDIAAQMLSRKQVRRRYAILYRPEERIYNTGFFKGITGIGYTLLRLQKNGADLPSVLAVD